MDDSFEGSSSETTESTAETNVETDAGETREIDSVTDAEVASAFDEEDSVPGKTDSPTGKETGTEIPATKDVPVKTDQPDNKEIAGATDAPSFLQANDAKTKETSETDKNAEVTHVKCIRDDLAGKEHPETGVPYETRIVEVNGKQLEVTVPRFESDFDFKLEKDQLQLDRGKHNEICYEKLKEYCDQNPEWAKEHFSDKQLDQINNGMKPEGYIWHHDGGEVGHMQLVDSRIHHETRHTGGIAIWGNKSKYT